MSLEERAIGQTSAPRVKRPEYHQTAKRFVSLIPTKNKTRPM
jgi:hypothetical protein